jgi:hypothetical protein
MSVRVIASWGAALVLAAACDKVSAQAAVPSPVPDARGASYELQEKCARDAREWYNRWRQEMSELFSAGLMDYTNHYSVRLGRCFILTQIDGYTGKQRDSTLLHTEALVDVLENRRVGSYGTSSGYAICEVNQTQCTSRKEWASLVKPYMQD